MQASAFTLSAADGEQIVVDKWSADDLGGNPAKGIVQIAHGMGEHAARYRRLGEALVDAGYVVYANDHRGHGRSAGSPDRYGNFGAGGWRGLVDDMAALTATARREHPGIPLVVVGHSMGSFALQSYLLDHNADIDGAVLSGTTAVDVIAGLIDTDQPADLSAFNAPFEPARTDFDWLSRDAAEVDAYVVDPACGFGVDVEGMRQMLSEAPALSDPQRLSAIRSDLPIHLFSGTADPIAGEGALVQMVADRYRQAGVSEVTVELYPDARHETLNETNRDEVTAHLITWLDQVVARPPAPTSSTPT